MYQEIKSDFVFDSASDGYEGVESRKQFSYIRFTSQGFPFESQPRELSDKSMLILLKLFIWQQQNKDICPFGFFPYQPLEFEKKIKRPLEDICAAVQTALSCGVLEKATAESLFLTVSDAFASNTKEPSNIPSKVDLEPKKSAEKKQKKEPVEKKKKEEEKPDLSDIAGPAFPCRNGLTFCVSESLLCELEKAYPTMDVQHELQLARQWLINNPSKKKTPGGMPRFLNDWFNRAMTYRKKPVAVENNKVARTKSDSLKKDSGNKVDSKGREVL